MKEVIEKEFFLTDMDSKTLENEYVIRLYGCTKENEKIIALIKYYPYYYVKYKNVQSALKTLRKKLSKELNKNLIKIEIVEKKELNNIINVLKISGKNIDELEKTKTIAEKIKGFIEKRESDVPPPTKFLLDNELHPLSLVKVRGNKIEKIGREDITILGETFNSLPVFIEKPHYVAFDIETYSNKGVSPTDEIIMISLCYWNGKKEVMTTKNFKNKPSYIKIYKNEKEMLEEFVKKIKDNKIDFIVGYNSDGFDFPFIKTRCAKHGISMNIGVDNSNIRTHKHFMSNSVRIKGLTHIDLYQFIIGALRTSLQTEIYTLDAVSEEMLGKRKVNIKHEDIYKLWDEGKTELLAKYNLVDSELTAELFEYIYPIMLEISKLTLLPLFNVCRSGYSNYVENHFLKEMKKENELFPNKPGYNAVRSRYHQTFKGGFVYQPIPGIYDNICIADFKSLYPTIIVSHNISPETIDYKKCKKKEEIKVENKKHVICNDFKGVFPRVLENLINKRLEVKHSLKTMNKKCKDYPFLKSRDKALKTILNASYGYLGFPNARLYSLPAVETVTALGRMYVHKAIEKAKKEGFKVCYGDTDSLFFALNGKTKNDALTFIKKINKEFPGIMELELEGFFPRGIFVSRKRNMKGAKKRYALIDENGRIIVKGFEFVRRDWSEISKKTQHEVLKAILKEGNKKKAVQVIKNVINNLRKNKIKLDDVIIYTQLRKNIESYASIGPHVAAAIKAKKAGYNIFPGMMMKYVVTKGKGSISERSFIYEQALNEKKEYDPDYYINNQVLPAVKNILAVLSINEKEVLDQDQTSLKKFT